MNIVSITTRSGSTYRLEGDTLTIHRTDQNGGRIVGPGLRIPGDDTIPGVRIIGHVAKGQPVTFDTPTGPIRTSPAITIRRTRVSDVPLHISLCHDGVNLPLPA